MYLKRLEVRGFKSFASKTVFDFEPGITAIVGPNGSGKSNVVDALAWVMGEQGAKNLRGGKMEDVIFAGTSGRQPLGRAQVALTIDNSDGVLPIEYSEVTISRTLFRAGGSEYEINGSPARLLDIQELLSDSGMGREMHVIVGQGQLDRILQATAEERRGFIEEAAGILKHRRRKERSVRKLDAMRANLDRVRDLTEEVRRQLGPLSRQAETARKAQRIQYDVRDARARLLADDIEQQQARVAQLLADDQGLDEQLAALSRQIDTAKLRHQELDGQLTSAGQAAHAAREHRFALSGLQERFRSLFSVTEERLRAASAPLMKSSGLSSDEAEKQVQQAEEELKDAVSTRDAAAIELTEATQARETAERAARIAAKAYTDSLQAEADRQRAISVAESALANAQAKRDSLTSQREHLSSEGQYGQESVSELEEQLDQTRAEVETAQTALDEAQHALETADERVREARESLREHRDELNDLKTQRTGIQARLDVLREALRPQQGSAREALADLELAEITELFRVEDGWDRAIVAALALEDTDQLWAPTQDILQQATELLHASSAGSARIHHPRGEVGSPELDDAGVHADLLPALERIIPHTAQGDDALIRTTLASLMAGIFLAETLDDAETQMAALREAGVLQPWFRWATRSGEVLTCGWVELTGGGEDSQNRGWGTTAVEQRASIDQADNSLEEVNKAMTALHARTPELENAVQQQEEQRRQVRDNVQEVRGRLTTYRERMASTQNTIQKTQRTAERTQQQLAELDQRLEKAQRDLAQAQEQHETALAAQRVATEQADDESAAPSQEEQDRTEAAARQARQQETDLRLSLRTMEASADQARSRVEQAKRRVASAKLAEQEYYRALARQKHTTARLTQLKAGVQRALDRIASSVERSQRDETSLTATRDDLTQQREAVAEQVSELTTHWEELRERNHARQLARQEQELLLEQLSQKSLDELGYTAEYLIATFGTAQPVPEFVEPNDDTGDDEAAAEPSAVPYDRAEQEKRLKRAQRELRALGKVNPLALEEYKAVDERHQFLSEQLADLEQSRKDLLNIIEEVDATVLRVFTEAYQDTAEQFQHVFSTLFPGGEGSLELTEPDNMLETGVEVHARPAGKKVTRLSLLSGGERSLAAIALLVSIFKARPSPFYVMDEVEAALDDTNLSRLLTIFKELQQDSQLIIITHQQRTMEIADALYGVSMRGDGVSQVISQRLDRDDA